MVSDEGQHSFATGGVTNTNKAHQYTHSLSGVATKGIHKMGQLKELPGMADTYKSPSMVLPSAN